MKKTLILIMAAFASYNALSQPPKHSKKIIITVNDTTNLYNRVKFALGKSDFAVREDGSTDTLTTHIRLARAINGYCRVRAVLKDNTITLNGIYSLKKIDGFGYLAESQYKNISYYKGCKTWAILERVAGNIEGAVEYSE